MKMQRDEPIAPPVLVREQPAPPSSMDVDTVTRVTKKPRVDPKIVMEAVLLMRRAGKMKMLNNRTSLGAELLECATKLEGLV